MKTALNQPVPAFVAGDRVAFVGDSITHNGWTELNVALFYATRFPKMHFNHTNCGISGDTAPLVLDRFDRDVAIHHPTVSTVMLGMNDVGRELYGKEKTTPADLEAQSKAIRVYAESMEILATKLVEAGSKLIFLTPSIYDQTAQLDEANGWGVNDGLTRCAEQVVALAETFNSPVVDFHTLMSRVSLEQQQDDPTHTIVGEDRVHPGEPGHLLMAYELLRSQEMPSEVSTLELDAATGQVIQEGNCRVEPDTHTISKTGFSFSCQEFSLPFPVSEIQRPVMHWVPFQEQLNRQFLTVKNLDAGRYELMIDDVQVATYFSEELASGVNLAELSNTPQMIQSLGVRDLMFQWHEFSSQLRTIVEIQCNYLKNDTPIPTEKEALQQALHEVVEKEAGTPWYDYMKEQAGKYQQIYHLEEELRQQMNAALLKAEQVNQPQPHRWTLSLLSE